MVTYRDVTMAPDDIEWLPAQSAEDALKEALFEDHEFELFLVQQGLVVALEKVTALHRKVANQLIARAVNDPSSSRWAGRAICVSRQAKRRRQQLRRLLVGEVGHVEAGVIIDALTDVNPRAEWGSDA